MKRTAAFLLMLGLCLSALAQSNVYFTSEITPESLVKIFQTLGVEPVGHVAIKISTGESGGMQHRLRRQQGQHRLPPSDNSSARF